VARRQSELWRLASGEPETKRHCSRWSDSRRFGRGEACRSPPTRECVPPRCDRLPPRARRPAPAPPATAGRPATAPRPADRPSDRRPPRADRPANAPRPAARPRPPPPDRRRLRTPTGRNQAVAACGHASRRRATQPAARGAASVVSRGSGSVAMTGKSPPSAHEDGVVGDAMGIELHCGRWWDTVGHACGTRVAGLLPPSHPGSEFGQPIENP
jgi:hypothetical protein